MRLKKRMGGEMMKVACIYTFSEHRGGENKEVYRSRPPVPRGDERRALA